MGVRHIHSNAHTRTLDLNPTKQKAVRKTATETNALADAEELLRLRKETLPEDDVKIGMAMTDLGWAYGRAHRYADALSIYQAITLTLNPKTLCRYTRQ